MKVFSATDIGLKRSMNQDFIFTSEGPVGNLPNLFVVADGMGGHNAGDFASRYGVSVLVESVRKDKNFNPVKILRNAIEAEGDWIRLEMEEDMPTFPPVSDLEDLELREGEIARNIGVNVRFYDGWDE